MKPYRYVIGVDPGASGAAAHLELGRGGRLLAVADLPVFDGINHAGGMMQLFDDMGVKAGDPNTIVVVEDVHTMPKNGAIASFKLGCSKGSILGVCAGLGLQVVKVSPQVWKKAMGFKPGADKSASRLMAMDYHPLQKDLFKRVKDDGRAEAVLLAHWYVEKKWIGDHT